MEGEKALAPLKLMMEEGLAFSLPLVPQVKAFDKPLWELKLQSAAGQKPGCYLRTEEECILVTQKGKGSGSEALGCSLLRFRVEELGGWHS